MEYPYTQSLLLYAYHASSSALVHALKEAGHDRIRPKHGAVFANIDAEGTRASLLAERAGMGKPAMGELIDELERLGYVRRIPDPGDRRAKLIVPTDAAKDVTDVVHRVNQALEVGFRQRLGGKAYEVLRAALLELSPIREPQPRMSVGRDG
jgi:DNA-binding MarR family transcriptional regulator